MEELSAPDTQTSSVTAQRAWMRLPSGRRLDLLDPDPMAWKHADLCTRLSRTYRWGGESCWALPLSVAQHSLLVLELRREQATGPLQPIEQLHELLHDAEEGFLGFDCISPLKRVLGQPFSGIEARLSQAIRHRYGLPIWSASGYHQHKQADLVAAASEAVHCVGWTPDEVREILGITADILLHDPLAKRYGERFWEPWPASVCAERFHDELMILCNAAGIG